MTELATEKLIVSAGKLKPGDWVSEFDDTVKAVRESDRRLGVREVEFERQPGPFFLFCMDWYHVDRQAAPDDAPPLVLPRLTRAHGKPDGDADVWLCRPATLPLVPALTAMLTLGLSYAFLIEQNCGRFRI